jgi:hypothetical protein
VKNGAREPTASGAPSSLQNADVRTMQIGDSISKQPSKDSHIVIARSEATKQSSPLFAAPPEFADSKNVDPRGVTRQRIRTQGSRLEPKAQSVASLDGGLRLRLQPLQT